MKENNGEIIVKKRKNPFVQIDNNVFCDNRLSYKAKGLLGYLLSKPDNWVIRIKDLYNQSTDGYTSIRNGLTELQLTGYLELRTRYDPDNNEFRGRKYFLYEEPLFDQGFRLMENKNKNIREDEEITLINPLGNNKKMRGL